MSYFLSLRVFFKILNNIYSYYEHTKATEGRRWQGEQAISKCFSFFLFVFFLHTDNVYIFIGLINVWKDCQEGTKRKMGPNDVFHVVWAIVSFSLLLSVFFLHILII